MHSLRLSQRLILSLIVCLLGTSATIIAQDAVAQDVATFDIDASGVTWSPLTADKMLLTVSGPSGDFRFELEAGEKAAFDIFDKAGALLQDGTYTWQMTTLPSVSPETREAMKQARAEGTRFTGILPPSFTQSGTVRVEGGYFVLPSREAANKPAEVAAPNKDQVIADDLIVNGGSACIGLDCTNGEVFGDDTLRLKENNLRIMFEDTSATANFPSNDWQLTANSSDNGGANMFSIDDLDGGHTPFTIEASAPSHSLYVDDGGRVGLGTSTPVVEMHIVSGDSPTVRLEQDGSSGFTSQTWDMAGNETNFFIRDATNGSLLPFKILPAAPTNSLYIDSEGDIGLQTASPRAPLHVLRSDARAQIYIQEKNTSASISDGMIFADTAQTTGVAQMLNMRTDGARPRMTMTHGGNFTSWNFDVLNVTGNFAFIRGGSGGPEFIFDATNGDLRIDGNYIRGGVPIPDWVFDADYDLMPLDDVKAFIDKNSHLPDVPSTAEVEANGLDMTAMQLALLQKVEELTLYTLDQHETIRQLQERLEAVESAQQ